MRNAGNNDFINKGVVDNGCKYILLFLGVQVSRAFGVFYRVKKVEGVQLKVLYADFYRLIISVLIHSFVPFPCGASSFALTQKKQKVKAPIGFFTLRGLEKPTTCKLAGCFSPAQTAESLNNLPRSDMVVAQTVQVA